MVVNNTANININIRNCFVKPKQMEFGLLWTSTSEI